MPAEPDSHRDKRQKVDPQLSRGSATGVDYKKIDDEINGQRQVRRWGEQFGDDLHDMLYANLLTIIVEQSAGRLHKRYGDWKVTTELLEEKSDLKQKLQTAWKSHSFRDVVDLDYLRASPALPSAPQNGALEDAWQVPYQGNCHTLLFQNINAMYESQPYLNVCAITQSSGTGKSRMVHEQANLVFTLPMNIRTSEGIQAAYPPPDEPLHPYLVESRDADECKRHFLTFFMCLFSHAAEELRRVFPNQRRVTQGKFASMWRTHMSDQTYRRNFYAKVVEMCNSDLANRNWLDLVSQANENLDTLVRSSDARCLSTTRVRIMVYIDEAHELKTKYSNGKQLDILCSVLVNFCTSPLFCLLLSTQSLLSFLAPPSKASPSERAWRQVNQLLAPITETPFDCSPDPKISSGVLHMDDLSKIGYLAKWGRPLWWTWLDDRIPRHAREQVERELVDFARIKLICHHAISDSHAQLSHAAQLAVLDVLIGLDFEPNRVPNVQEDMVTSHMRIAYSVPRHREYFRSGYPSEPLLAEAAAQQIHAFQNLRPANTNVMIDILCSDFNNTLIDLGQRGEVVMRLLLMRAYMDSVIEELTSAASTINFSRGCKLITFIERLFSKEHADSILASKPDDLQLNTTFRTAFRDSVIRFTHFVKAGDSSGVTTEAAFAAFVRGMAFICHPTQRCVDIVIPILLNKQSPLQESAMSAILIQVKRHVTKHGPQTYAFTQEKVNFFPPLKKHKPKRHARIISIAEHRPYITFIAELGVQLNRSTLPYIHISSQPKVQSHPDSTHPRFSVTAYGCSDTLYRVIKTEQNNTYQNLLATREFLKEHDRQDNDSLSVVMRLKPYWERSKNSYHWVDSRSLNKG